MDVLVTGAASGLGRAVAAHFGGMQLNRGEFHSFNRTHAHKHFDAIVHCAFNSSKDVSAASAATYVNDNLFLTQDLLGLDCSKFIYISSQDVYPASVGIRREDVDFDLAGLRGAYPFTKLFSELAVQSRSRNFLICRPTTFLGSHMRPNTTSRLLTQRSPRLFLSAQSRFNYVLHRDVVSFIDIALQRDLTGIYNIASRGTVSLADICEDLGLSPAFGDYVYDIGNVDNAKAAEYCPSFSKSAADVLNEYIDSLGDAFVGAGRVADRER